jgi:hypothetical protein
MDLSRKGSEGSILSAPQELEILAAATSLEVEAPGGRPTAC